MNKKHWNTVEIENGIPDPEIRKMIDHSYDLVVSRVFMLKRESQPRQSRAAKRRARHGENYRPHRSARHEAHRIDRPRRESIAGPTGYAPPSRSSGRNRPVSRRPRARALSRGTKADSECNRAPEYRSRLSPSD